LLIYGSQNSQNVSLRFKKLKFIIDSILADRI
jgi:hypothetical protein